MQGGGGSRSTGKSCALGTKVILNLIQDLTRETRENSTPVRFRIKYGMTQAESVLQLDPSDRTPKEVSAKDVTKPSLRAVVDRVAIQSTNAVPPCHAELVSASVPCRKLPVTLDRSRNKFGMTLKEMPLVCGFTMAEILLSLTIIGVVAAITLPSLTGNINERTWNTQRKALYARMSQAIALMPALNGYGTLRETTDSAGSISIEDTAAETFVTAGLSKVLKINNICDSGHLADCGITSKFTTLAGSTVDEIPTTMGELNSTMINNSTADVGTGSSYSMLDTKAAAFETQNGESILLFYNPACVSNMGETNNYYVQTKICVNMVYDLNSSKGPNTIGKDMGFLTILYPSDSVVVAPMPFNGFFDGVNDDNASSICTTNAGEDYRIPTRDELASIFVNKNLLGLNWGSSHLYSSTKFQANWGIVNWVMVLSNGQFRLPNSTSNWGTLCVKRN